MVTRYPWLLVSVFALAVGLQGCSGCDDDAEEGASCGVGERLNPITGECLPDRLDADAGMGADGAVGDGGAQDAAEDGGGVDDGGVVVPDVSPEELACRQEYRDSLPQPQLVGSEPGDYKLALPPGLANAEATGVGAPAHIFSDGANGYAGFIASIQAPNVGQDADSYREFVSARVQNVFGDAEFLSTGRRTLTHDGYVAIVGTKIKTSSATQADVARDAILEEVAGGSVSASLGESFGSIGGEALINYGVIDRGDGDVVVTLTVSSRADYEDDAGETGYRVDDVTGAMSVAEFIGELESECVSYEYENQAAVDIILSIDVSTSMSGFYESVRNYADTFVQILDQRNIDWRLGVTSSNCDSIDEDPEVSPEVAALYGDNCQGACPGGQIQNNQCCISLLGQTQCFPLPGGSGVDNGALCNGRFTQDADEFKACVDDLLGSSGAEFTGTIGAAAIDRALPRSNTDPSKLRPGAATIILSVTDEYDEYVQNEMGWEDGLDGGAGDPTTLPGFSWARVEAVIQPFVDYYLSPEASATLFSIHWLPGQNCVEATEAAAGIDRMTSLTGGSAGDLCGANIDETLEEVAEASAGLASSIRLLGTPIPPSIQTRVGRVSEGRVDLVERSRLDGWDYDAITNAVVFNGSSEPQVGETVVTAYYRWDDSIISCETDNDCPVEQKYVCVDGQCR